MCVHVCAVLDLILFVVQVSELQGKTKLAKKEQVQGMRGGRVGDGGQESDLGVL